MGILEEAAGAFAAVEAAKKLDPNAGIFTEGVAAVAGFEGTEAVTNFIEKKEEEKGDGQS
jgi:K+-transporting ATPase A subunit